MERIPHYFGIITEELEAAQSFYTRHFGFEVVVSFDWFCLMRRGALELAFMKPGLDTQAEAFRGAYAGSGAWLTLEVADVDAEFARLVEAGVSVAFEPRDEPWGDRHFALRDPSGLTIDIVRPGS